MNFLNKPGMKQMIPKILSCVLLLSISCLSSKLGTVILSTELLSPVLSATISNIFIPTNLDICNPIDNIKESEPYLQDNTWHIIGAAATNDANYYILKQYLNDPIVLSAIITTITWTQIECIDAFQNIGFSVSDIKSNTIGIAFSTLKIKYPNIPVKLRLGVNKPTQLLPRNNYYKFIMKNHYNIMKTEIVYSHDNLYAGVALSTSNNNKDIFGLTLGYDIAESINKYINLSTNITIWK
jgi:hypothetical protein